MALRSWTFEIGSPPATSSISKALSQLKSDLLHPTIGNKIILQLKSLSALYGPSASAQPASPAPSKASHVHPPSPTAAPIHAVCLDCTDAEANERIFNRLPRSSKLKVVAKDSSGTVPSVQNADLPSVLAVLNEVQLVNLIEKPDPSLQGLSLDGQLPSGGKGKDQVSDGLGFMGQQLMALGFATSYAVFPDHSGERCRTYLSALNQRIVSKVSIRLLTGCRSSHVGLGVLSQMRSDACAQIGGGSSLYFRLLR